MSDPQNPALNDRVLYFDPKEKRSFAAVITDTQTEEDGLTTDMHVGLHVFGGMDCDDDNVPDVPFGVPPTKKACWHWPPSKS